MSAVALHALAFIASLAFGQADSREEDYYSWCRSQGGTPVGSYSTLHCVPPETGGQEGGAVSGGTQIPSGPSVEQREAWRRAQEEEALRAENRKRAREKLQADDAERARQESAQFQSDKARALTELKGVDSGDAPLKGVNGGMQGLKGIDASGAGLKTMDGAGGWTPRAFATPSEQLRCGASLARQAIVAAGYAGQSGPKAGKARALIASLDAQAANSFSGAPVEMPCTYEGQPLKFQASPRRSMAEVYHTMFKQIERAADEMVRAVADSKASKADRATAVRKLDAMIKAQEGLKPASSSAPTPRSEAAPKAPAAEGSADEIRALEAAKAALAKANEAEELAVREEHRVRDELAKIASENNVVAKKPEAADAAFDDIMNAAAGGKP
jgi:hypothetical protein